MKDVKCKLRAEGREGTGRKKGKRLAEEHIYVQPKDTYNSVVMAREKGDRGEVEVGKGGDNGRHLFFCVNNKNEVKKEKVGCSRVGRCIQNSCHRSLGPQLVRKAATEIQHGFSALSLTPVGSCSFCFLHNLTFRLRA